MPLVGVWTLASLDGPTLDIALLHSEHKKDLEALIGDPTFPRPGKVYLVAPNGRGLDELLAYYVANKASVEAFTPAESLSLGEFTSIWRHWCSLVGAISLLNRPAAEAYISVLKEAAPSWMPRWPMILDWMTQYAQEVLGPLSQAELFETVTGTSTRNWWGISCNALTRIAAFRHKAKAAAIHTPALSAFDVAAAGQESRLRPMFLGSLCDRFFGLSAFCISAAADQLKLSNSQLAFIFTHRALDIYFQSLAIQHNLILEGAGGIYYRDTPSGQVRLIETEHLLVKEGIVASDRNRRLFLIEINRMRNQHLLTHGTHHVRAAEASRALGQALKIVGSIEGSKKWEALAFPKSSLLSSLQPLIFEAVPDIATYVEELH